MSGKEKNSRIPACIAVITLILAAASPAAAVVPECGDANHPYPVGDLNHDCKVNFFDLAIFAMHWLECTAPECRGLEVTGVKIYRGELIEGQFIPQQEVHKLTVGDTFSIYVEVTNFGSETEQVLNLYDWDLCPQTRIEVIGTGSICLTYIDIEPGQSIYSYPFCLSEAFKAKESGWVTMNIYVKDWYGSSLCEYKFTFEVL